MWNAFLSLFKKIPIEHREVLHNVYLRSQMPEIVYEFKQEFDRGYGIYPIQLVMSIDQGHCGWVGLIEHVATSYQLDREKIKDFYWIAWVEKQIPTFDEESGDKYTTISKILNSKTDPKVLARYILNHEWDFWFTLQSMPHAGYFLTSFTPSPEPLMTPSELRQFSSDIESVVNIPVQLK
jgi:hypothetical protein